ncbi:MAG: hypothetical protein IKV59_02935 [Lachnospiraceae bacterium]|nr:hypothetical protein [Lachnospiraceae bacterium]
MTKEDEIFTLYKKINEIEKKYSNMERLTKRELAAVNGKEIVLCERKEEDCNDSCMYKRCKWNEQALRKLKEYEDLEEQGLLLRLPCKIGRKVFYVQKCLAPSCKECKGFLRVDNCYCQYKARIFEQKFDYRHLQAFGKSVFLTREEAEAALAKMEEGV